MSTHRFESWSLMRASKNLDALLIFPLAAGPSVDLLSCRSSNLGGLFGAPMSPPIREDLLSSCSDLDLGLEISAACCGANVGYFDDSCLTLLLSDLTFCISVFGLVL